MIRRNGEYRIDRRENMRGGNGEVVIEHLWEPGDDLKAGNRLFAKLLIPPGCGIGFHEHLGEEEVFYILSGDAEVEDGAEKTVLHPGDSILTGSGCGHSIRCHGGDRLEVLAVITTVG